jgi:hypothetical protein
MATKIGWANAFPHLDILFTLLVDRLALQARPDFASKSITLSISTQRSVSRSPATS